MGAGISSLPLLVVLYNESRLIIRNLLLMNLQKQRSIRFLLPLYWGIILLSCISCTGGAENQYNIVPLPNEIKTASGRFVLDAEKQFYLSSQIDSSSRKIIDTFIIQLNKTAELSLLVHNGANADMPDKSLSFIKNDKLGTEAYMLKITPDKVLVQAATSAGFFYAIQTIKQLLPSAIYDDRADTMSAWTLPCVEITDAPRFQYRGMMLDVCRHFFSVEEVKRYIDVMAIHKLNTFHWHLSDDQGWRIEIKKYPRLTEIGSIRKKTMIGTEWENFDTTPYGGFYTQEQIRDVIAYAAERCITVIPEIDMPGHMMAALASYPELGCTGGPYDVSGQWGVREDVLCPGKETTFGFIEGVLSEVIALFPSKYIHVGGDECPKIRWEKCPKCQVRMKALGLKSDSKHKAEHYLQSYTMSRIEKYLNDNGRQMIGWEEILEGGIAPNATVMSWRGLEPGIEAARLHHQVIMSPNSHAYFDHYQTLEKEGEPLSNGGYISVEKVYSLDPVPATLAGENRKYVLGAQANMWTEYITTNEQLEYQLLPRLAALSEVQWTQPENKSWDRFLGSLDHIVSIYDALGMNYAKHVYEVLGTYTVNPEKGCVEAKLMTQGDAPIYYTLDGTEPTESSMRYTKPVGIIESCTLRAKVKRDNANARILVKGFLFNKATGRKATLNTKPSEKYKFTGASILTDGIRGEFNYSTGCWMGYRDEPFDVTIDLGKPTPVSSVKIGTMIQIGESIFGPVKLTVWTSDVDGKVVKQGEVIIPEATEDTKDGLKEFECSFKEVPACQVRIIAWNTRPIPAWHGASGENAYMFVDEVVIE